MPPSSFAANSPIRSARSCPPERCTLCPPKNNGRNSLAASASKMFPPVTPPLRSSPRSSDNRLPPTNLVCSMSLAMSGNGASTAPPAIKSCSRAAPLTVPPMTAPYPRTPRCPTAASAASSSRNNACNLESRLRHALIWLDLVGMAERVFDVAGQQLFLSGFEFRLLAHLRHPDLPLLIRVFRGVVEFVAFGALGDVEFASNSSFVDGRGGTVRRSDAAGESKTGQRHHSGH